MTQKNRKQLINFIFWSSGCSLLRAEGFSCSLDVFYEGVGISKFKCFIKKRFNQNFQLYFLNFWSSNPDPYPDSLEMLDQDPYPDQDLMNPDPHYLGLAKIFLQVMKIWPNHYNILDLWLWIRICMDPYLLERLAPNCWDSTKFWNKVTLENSFFIFC